MSYSRDTKDSILNDKHKVKSSIHSPEHDKLIEPPELFCDYMKTISSRFNEICELYLSGLSIDDVCFLKSKDLINLVPDNQHKHKLLMTIMVRRYLYPKDDSCIVNDINSKKCKDSYGDVEYSCDSCKHSCYDKNCNHCCDNY